VAAGVVSLAIDSVTPQVAEPGKTITVTGTITNGTSAPLTGFDLQLYTSQTWFTTRDDMNRYATGAENPGLSPVGSQDAISSSVRPGGTVSWHAQFTEAAAGYPQFGVYPLKVLLTDPSGVPAASGRILLPYWSRASQLSKLKIAWVWPLIDRPHRQVCPALTSNELAPSVAGGRLSDLLAAGTANPRSRLTWAVDPALLGDLSVMSATSGYATGGNPATCKGSVPEKTSHAAANWLATLKSATATQPTLITPYANTDVAALALHGLNADLTNAYRLGRQVSGHVLGRSFGTDFALPPGGVADSSVLTTLATAEHVTSVVLGSGEMPPVDSQFYYADDAVTSFRNMAGLKMNVLLADDEITGLLRGASSTMSASAQFGLAQQFLAETAMISSELPESHRSVVVSPPQSWGPSEPLASKLLQESSAPWLEPVTLSSLAGSHGSKSQVNRRAPAPTKSSPRPLSAGYLAPVKGQNGLDGQLSLYKSLLYQAPVNYTTGLDLALAATESSAWRGGPASAAGGQALIGKLSAYLTKARQKVSIISSPEITMAGSSGVLPVNIKNALEQDVQVRLLVSVPAPANGAARPLQVARVDEPIKIGAGQIVGVKIHVNSAPNGTTNLQLSLASKDGRQVPLTSTPLKVHSTRYGQDILILIAAAIGLLVLSSLWRSGRRALAAAGGGPGGGNTKRAADAEQSGDNAGTPPDWTEPGNVIGGAQNLTEAPDDLADARRWADDT